MTPDTFCLYGLLQQHRLVIPIDEGNTHNFIQSRIARFLYLDASPLETLGIMVGDDNTLECITTSRQVPLHIQGHTFVTDLFHLPNCNGDIVLGVQWLKQLGPITINYKTLTMLFSFQTNLSHS